MQSTSRKITPSHPTERARPAPAPVASAAFCTVSGADDRHATRYRLVHVADEDARPGTADDPVAHRSPSSAPPRPRIVDSGSYAHVGADGEPLITEHLGPSSRSGSDRPRARSVPPAAPSSSSSRPPKPIPRRDD